MTPVALGWRLFNLKRIDAASRDALFQIKGDEDQGPAPFKLWASCPCSNSEGS